MSEKTILFLLCTAFGLHAAEPASNKRHAETVAQLGQAIREIRTQVTSRPTSPNLSHYRNGPRIDGDPEQKKINNIEKK